MLKRPFTHSLLAALRSWLWPSVAATAPETTGNIPADTWVHLASQQGRFRAQFPGAPYLEYEQQGRGAYRLLVDDGRIAYSVTYSDISFSEEQAKSEDLQIEALDEVARVLAQKHVGGRNAKVLAIQLDKYPGREIRGELIEGIRFWARDYLVGGRLYLVDVMAESSIFNEKDAVRFQKSFQLIE